MRHEEDRSHEVAMNSVGAILVIALILAWYGIWGAFTQ